MGRYNSTDAYLHLLDQLVDNESPEDLVPPLMGYVKSIYRSDQENEYSAPMLWIGMYVAVASLVCILAMVADLLHGLRSRKLWFPCRYFRINATFISLIAIAMKLPVDLTSSMPGNVDQAGKLGSVAFMCTMMANLLPCLATMDSNELLSNITGLGILVITMFVNVCIQIHTGVVSYHEDTRILEHVAPKYNPHSLSLRKHRNTILAAIYESLLLLLLMLHVCSCLAILKSKKIIESKYKKHHPVVQPLSPTVGKLKQHVINDWIMAGSGSPEFITACFPTTSASGVICVLVTVLHTLTMYRTIEAIITKDCDSDYSWSMIVILIVQFIGVVIGTIAPLCRCFATLSFKVSPKIISNHLKVFEVESYWTSKLDEWKRGGTKLWFIKKHRRLEVVTEILKSLVLRLWIEIQEGVVVFCKIVSLVPFVFMMCVWYCLRCLKWLKAVSSSSENSEQRLKDIEALRTYVLHLEDETELEGRTLKGLKGSVDLLIEKGEKRQPVNLKTLITKSNGGFEGVGKFDNTNQLLVPCLLSTIQHQDCWSLPVVTLTTIAVSLRGIETDEVKNLLQSVWEGLRYVTLVEESFSVANEDVSCQKEAETLWKEVHVNHKWLGYEFPDCKAKTAGSIVEWFRDTAKNVDKSKHGRKDDPIHRSICANSMYHITKTVLVNHQTNVSHEVLFKDISSMIADIIAACLTNLPQVITRKCDTSTIEKREDSVKDAAILVGETEKIIDTIYKDRGNNIPNMDPSDLPFINKWREHLRLNCSV